jgi:hypothetical protein
MTVDLDQDQVDYLVVENLKHDYRSMAVNPMPEEDDLRDAIEVVLEYYLSHDDYKKWLEEKVQYYG